jgi:hypothetical protein
VNEAAMAKFLGYMYENEDGSHFYGEDPKTDHDLKHMLEAIMKTQTSLDKMLILIEGDLREVLKDLHKPHPVGPAMRVVFTNRLIQPGV